MLQNPNIRDEDYKGEVVDANLKNGPLEERKKTDFNFCIALGVLAIVYVLVGIVALFKGDFKKIYQGYDRNGLACGVDPQVKDFPYLLTGRNFDGNFKVSILRLLSADDEEAVDPTGTSSATITPPKSTPQSYKTYRIPASNIRQDNQIWDCVRACPSSQQVIECAPVVTKTSEEFGTYCGLRSLTDTMAIQGKLCAPKTNYEQALGSSMMLILDKIIIDWWAFFITSFLAIIAGVAVLFWVRYGAKCMVWSSIYVFMGLGAVMAIVLCVIGNIAGGVLLLLMVALVGIMTYCFRNTINFMCGILSAAAEFIKQHVILVAIPVGAGFFNMIFFVVWIIIMMKIYYLGDAQKGTDLGAEHKTVIQVGGFTTILMLFHIFAQIWIAIFIMHFAQWIICSSASIWYFSSGKEPFPVTQSLNRLLNFHIGTVAFGSLIIAIIKIVRAIVESALKNAEKERNGAAVLLFSCLKCCLGCIDRLVKFFGVHAYIENALTGKPFCDAAIDGFFLILRNAERFGVSMNLFELFEFFASLYIVILSLPITMLILMGLIKESTSLGFFILFAFIITFLIASLFSTLLIFSAETILHCYCIDYEISEQEGTNTAAYAPEVLREAIIEYKNAQEAKQQQ